MTDSQGNPMRITEIWAFLSIDPDDNDEGVIAAPIGNAPDSPTMPLIAADEARVESLKPIAAKMAKIFGLEIKLVKFSNSTIVERYQP